LKESESYFRERARAERAIAEETPSPQARGAHLELALRYVKAAESLYVRSGTSTELPDPALGEARGPTNRESSLQPALRAAFPLPASGAFSDLLGVIELITGDF
jgi:hypothetical protein